MAQIKVTVSYDDLHVEINVSPSPSGVSVEEKVLKAAAVGLQDLRNQAYDREKVAQDLRERLK